MGLFLTNGKLWRVVRVSSGDPRLVDRQGVRTVATTDPATRTVCISDELRPPILDRVLLHEISHAVTISHGGLEELHGLIPREHWVPVEEWAVGQMESHGIEAVGIASEVLGRPVCVGGWCDD